MAENRMEIMWGVRLLDEGFTSIPNLLVRSYRKLGIEHGEWGIICQILTYKHDTRDPYPSREDLADLMCCSWRQIEKWIASLKAKGFLKTGRRRNAYNKQWDNRVFNFKPLLDACMKLIGEEALPPTPEQFEIIWDDENKPCVPEVHVGSVPEVHVGLYPEVHTKKKSKKENIKDDCLIEAASAEIAAARSESSVSLELEHDEIYSALQQHVPAYCYIDNNTPLGDAFIAEAYLMLVNQFHMQLSPEAVRIACELYFDRACRAQGTNVFMRIPMDNPVGFFQRRYKDALKLYKLNLNKWNGESAHGKSSRQ